MQKHFVVLGLSVASLFFAQAATAEDLAILKSPDRTFIISRSEIRPSPPNYVGLWYQTVESKPTMVKGVEVHFKRHLEGFDCQAHKFRFYEVQYFDNDMKFVDVAYAPGMHATDWIAPQPGALIDKTFDVVCQPTSVRWESGASANEAAHADWTNRQSPPP